MREPFVAFGKPYLAIFDNGLENVGASMQDTLRDLDMNVEWAPIKTPTFKAFVEKYFGTLNKALFHKLGGAVPYGPKEMREYEIDPKTTAFMTLDMVHEIIYQYITEVYQMSRHRGLDMMAPLQKWEKLVAVHGIDVIDDLKLIDDACAYTKDAVLTRKGVSVEGLSYHDRVNTELLLKDLMPIAMRGRSPRARNSVSVKIKFDPSDISRINVWNHFSKEYVELPSRNPDYARGMSLWHHRLVRKKALAENEDFKSADDLLAAKERLNKTIESKNFSLLGKKASMRLLKQNKKSSPSIEHREALPSHNGNGELIAVDTGEQTRADNGKKPAGFRRGAKKAKETIRQKKKRIQQKMEDHAETLGSILTQQDGLKVKDPQSFMKNLGSDWT